MKLKKLVLFVTLLFCMAAPSASAGLRFTLLGSIDKNFKANANFGVGAGGLFELKLGKTIGIETGFIFTRRNMSHKCGIGELR